MKDEEIPQGKELWQLLDDVKKEYMGIAVPRPATPL